MIEFCFTELNSSRPSWMISLLYCSTVSIQRDIACCDWIFDFQLQVSFFLAISQNGHDMTCLSHPCGMHDSISINAKSFSPTPSLILTRTDKFLTFNIMHAINSCYDYSGNAGICLHLEQYFLCNVRKLPWAVIIIIFWLA